MVFSTNSTLRFFVKRLNSRSILNAEEQAAILELTGKTEDLGAHIDFVREGQKVDHCCLVLNGLVGRFRQNSKGLRQITGIYIPGDMSDLSSMVNSTSAWGLTSLTSSVILRLSHADLSAITRRYPRVAEAFWRDCVVDASIFSEWIVNVGRRDALARIAHLFCEMALRSERAGHGDRCSFPLPITQMDIGDATGLTGIHVNRILRKLRSQSIVELQAGIVTVHDWVQLVRISDFDDSFMLTSDLPYNGSQIGAVANNPCGNYIAALGHG